MAGAKITALLQSSVRNLMKIEKRLIDRFPTMSNWYDMLKEAMEKDGEDFTTRHCTAMRRNTMAHYALTRFNHE